MRHFAHVLPKTRAKSGKNGVPEAALTTYVRAKKPCKNGLFVGKDKLLRARAAIMLKFILKILLLGAHIVAWKCLFIVKQKCFREIAIEACNTHVTGVNTPSHRGKGERGGLNAVAKQG